MRIERLIGIGPALGLALAGACGGDSDDARPSATTRANEPPAAASATLLEEAGELTASDASDGRGRYDRYFVDVAAGDRLVVSLTSSAFDPILEVTPPGAGALVNDDWQGDTSRSQIELHVTTAGAMKVEVRSYRADGVGAYRVAVRRAAEGESHAQVPILAAGDTVEGELAEGDHALSGGDVFDSFVIRADGPLQVAVTPASGDPPRTTLVSPSGLTLQPTNGRYEAPDRGSYRLQVIGRRGARYRVSVASTATGSAPLLARAHHQFNEILSQLGGSAGGPAQPARPAPLAVRIGDRLHGNLAENDLRLPSGELYDVYELAVAQPAGDVTIEMESTTIDSFLRVEGPSGQTWENDDHGGSLNARVDLTLAQAGTYRIVTTSYRAGETGAYELKVLTRRDQPAPAQTPSAPAGDEQTIAGQLAAGDSTLASGEYADEHRFTWPAGARIHLEARSTAFDTYLIVHPPNGPQRDNDDMIPGQTLNAGMDLQVNEPGEWRVLVTSYRPGMTGDYTLVVSGGAGQPPSAQPPSAQPPSAHPPSSAAPSPSAGSRTQTGTLAQGDTTLRSGEYMDTYPMTFTPRSAVSIRLESSAFDTYLIVRTPSGGQEDNDDLQPGVLNSGVDIPVAEPGTYQIIVTSYRPGETGAYTLTVTEGPSVVAPAPAQGGGPPAASGGRVWGLFAGITDYPGAVNDLPECANDARKLAEAVRNQGNMPSDQEFLLTDAQATTQNIRRAMQTIAQRIGPEDVFVFFYSGHGGQTEGGSRDPRELDQRDEYLLAYDGQLMDDELGTLFDAMRARVSLVAIDACFAGGFAKDVITRPGRVGMFSSEEDVTSAVAGRFQAGGYLSHFLRLGIQGEADNDPHNQILTVGELTHYTWVQFGRHASDVRMSMGYQHLVVDRGAVRTSEVLWAVNR